MAYSSLFDERPDVAASSFEPLKALFAWFGNLRAKHAQRVALSSLLDFDQALLDDLGIDRQDVVEALRHPHASAAKSLTDRRARRASDWLTHP
jgi:uncharacterized protein YjiS (DUF1127 family)